MDASARNVLGLAGSLRGASVNASLLRHAATLAPDGVGFELFTGLAAVPHFNQELEGELTPAPVRELRARIADADALLVATPEYNGSMPGVLKNALDWASRPPGESVLAGKPAAVIGASPGRFGAKRAQADVRKVLAAIGAEVLDDELPVPRAHEAFDDSGALRDRELADRLSALLGALADLAGGPPPFEADDSAAYSAECQRLAAAR